MTGLLDKDGCKLLHSVSGCTHDDGTRRQKPSVGKAGLSDPTWRGGLAGVVQWIVEPLAPSTDSADGLMAQDAAIAAGIHD